MLSFLNRLFDHNKREITRLRPLVAEINALEPGLEKLDDGALKGKTAEFKGRLAAGEALDGILPEAFAVVREASKRIMGMRHFDEQLLGGMVLHQGKIAEMKTGEGKTLVATLPVYLNALTGKGVHVITVNDYLAERDSRGKGNFKGMGNIYEFLGMTVGCVLHGMTNQQKKDAYHSDITYGTNNEFGFDYLRDNMAVSRDYVVQRKLHYTIVDEVDSILIDEARTPLIISGPAEESTELYHRVNRIIPRFQNEADYKIDEKHKNVTMTEEGVAKAEKLLGIENLYDEANIDFLHHTAQALRAYTLFKREVDYIVKEGKVVIVDEFTGRLMPGRRWSDGLHQAIEAKENVRIEEENQTLASITFQNYFRMYEKLAGMTGTASTEAQEFSEIYKLDVIQVPTHREMVRIDNADQVFKTESEKNDAIIEEIADCHKRGQPVLVGTTSIEKNERIAALLKRRGVPHAVLNAKQHKKEASIISNAGQAGSVTIATNMAGRGTDIQLGAGVIELGGLHILGTERHESRRIDNQLRGRSGRQGDPGSSRFFLSLDDELLRLFGSERLTGMMKSLGMQEGEVIEHPWVSKAIERAQKAVEGRNFELRKHLLEYDDVMNRQREVIYAQRRSILEGADMSGQILEMADNLVSQAVEANLPGRGTPEEGAGQALVAWLQGVFNLSADPAEIERTTAPELAGALRERIRTMYLEREKHFGAADMRELERMVMLNVIDSDWKNHLYNMDRMKEGIGLSAYGQKDPLIEYKREGFQMFMAMNGRIREKVLEVLFHVRSFSHHEAESRPFAYGEGREERPAFAMPVAAPAPDSGPEQMMGMPPGMPPGMMPDGMPPMMGEPPRVETFKREAPKVGRNDPCPCGSGKKFKKCHGAAA